MADHTWLFEHGPLPLLDTELCTQLCSISTALREPIYLDVQAPDRAEVAARTALYWSVLDSPG